MAIKLANGDISALYLGSTAVSAAYLGSSQVWSAGGGGGGGGGGGSTLLLVNFDGSVSPMTGSGVVYDSVNKAFGASSMEGGTASITGAAAAEIIDGMAGDFTVEFWGCIDYQSAAQPFMINSDSFGLYVSADWFNFSNWVELFDNANWYSTQSVAPGILPYPEYDSTVTPVLKHIAIVRSGTDISVYVGGNRVANFTGPLAVQSGGTSNGIYIYADGAADTFWIDSLRISSAALYSGASFTVPASPPT